MASVSTKTRALAWFTDAEKAKAYDTFQREFLSPGRRLFNEVALAKLGHEPRSLLDVGAGTGDDIPDLIERYPKCNFTLIDPSEEMVNRAQNRLNGKARILCEDVHSLQIEERYEVILSHSNFRFWHDPVSGLRKVYDLLADGGLAYILDLRSDLDPELRHALVKAVPPELEEFMEDQINSSYSFSDLKDFALRALPPESYRVLPGQFAGEPFTSRNALNLVQENPSLADAVYCLNRLGFRVDGGEEAVCHMFIRKDA